MNDAQLPTNPSPQLTQRLDIDFALKAAGLGVWEVDPLTNTVNWDDRCRELFGLAKDNRLPYEQAIRYIHPDDVEGVNQAVLRATNPQLRAPYDMTYRTLGADDGQLRWVRFQGRADFSQTGELLRFIGIAQEVTGEVLNRQKKEQSQQQVLRQFEQSPVGIATISGPQLTFRSANPFYGQLVGRSPEELVGNPLLEVLPEIAGQGFDQLLRQVITTSTPFVASEVAAKLRRNMQLETIYVDLHYQPQLDIERDEQGVLVIATDVTKQVITRRQVEESEARFRSMAEGTSVLIAVGDESNNATYFNRAWTEFTGRPMASLLQSGWVDLVHPDDRDRYVNLYLDAFRVREPFTGEFRVRDPEGRYHWLLAEGVARFQPDGTFAGYISSCIDITSRKQSEEQQARSRLALERALEQARLSKEAADLGTFDMDPLSGVMIWDERCRLLFGISHHNPVSFDLDFIARLHPDDRERVVNVVQNVFIKSISNGDYDIEYRTIGADDQQIRWVKAKGKVYFDEQERPIRFIGSVLNITDQVNAVQRIEDMVAQRTQELNVANQQLMEANTLLTRSNNNLQQFAYIASHDLQEPLRKIQAFGELLQTEHSGQLGEGAQHLKRMQDAASRMSVLIRDLLAFSRVSTQRDTSVPVALDQVVSRVLGTLELTIEETKASITVGTLPVISGDALQLEQLFQNLLSNALKFQQPGQGRVPIIAVTSRLIMAADLPPSVRPIRLTSQYYRIDVADNGLGFDEQYLSRIFQVFQRLHDKKQYAGTGIGLAICERVAVNHGGAITATSQPGQGATFSVYLPA